MITGLKAGANDYAAKPFAPGELLARVDVGRRMLDLQDALASKLDELRLAHDRLKALREIVAICPRCQRSETRQG